MVFNIYMEALFLLDFTGDTEARFLQDRLPFTGFSIEIAEFKADTAISLYF